MWLDGINLSRSFIRGMVATIRSKAFLSSCLLSRYVKDKIYKTIILSVFYGCETCSHF
jgi:hypothetical protein